MRTATGHTLIDAALSRRDGRISEGSLSLLVGGTDADLAAARPVLDNYANNVVHVGPPGAGMTAKLCNNWLLYSNRHAALPALKAGRRSASISTCCAGRWPPPPGQAGAGALLGPGRGHP